jgi:hypothetical protein
VSFAPRPLRPVKSPRYPLDKRLGELQRMSGRHGEILGPSGTQTPTPQSSSLQPVAIPTEVSWLMRGHIAQGIFIEACRRKDDTKMDSATLMNLRVS